jgi:hypothetical protein
MRTTFEFESLKRTVLAKPISRSEDKIKVNRILVQVGCDVD